jgi:putative proteasome-type protease
MRIKAVHPYFEEISTGWGVALKNAFRELPDFTFPTE